MKTFDFISSTTKQMLYALITLKNKKNRVLSRMMISNAQKEVGKNPRRVATRGSEVFPSRIYA